MSEYNDYDAFAAGYSADNENNATNAGLMRFWHCPLHAMTDAFQAAGFILDAMREPEPDPAAETLFPAVYADLRTNPRLLFFRLIAP